MIMYPAILADVPIDYPGFYLIVWVGLFLGTLHVIMPCEDKFVFLFYAFGVARDWRQAFRILNFYGLGLFLTNLIIGAVLAYLGAVVSAYLTINRFIWNAIASLILIVSGIIMLIQVKRKRYWPHADQLQEITESLSTLRTRKRTAFFLGILAGIPPCIFETAVYLNAITLSLNYGWGNGVWTVFFFGIASWIGLYPLALIGTASGQLSRMLQGTTMHRLQEWLSWKKKAQSAYAAYAAYTASLKQNPSENIPKLEEPEISPPPLRTYTRIETFSGWAMIVIGIILLILAIFGLDLIPIYQVPEIPWPFK